MTDVVGKLRGFCHTLRHDGIDYGDCIEQLTYLLFLKMTMEVGMWKMARVEYTASKGFEEGKKKTGQFTVVIYYATKGMSGKKRESSGLIRAWGIF